MATTFDLSGGLLDAGVPFAAGRPAIAWVALENAGVLIDAATGEVHLGRWKLDIDSLGAISEALPSTASGAGWFPDGGFAYRLFVQYRDGAPGAERETFISAPFTLTADRTLAAALGDTIKLTAISAAEWVAFQAKYDELKGVIATTEGVMTAVDADEGSAFRVQQDLRLTTTIDAAVEGSNAAPLGWNVSRVRTKLDAGLNIVVGVVGDSVPQGSAPVTAGQDCISLLCADLTAQFGVTVTKTNLALGGHTVNWERMASWAGLLAAKPDLIVLGHTGKNDIAYDSSAAIGSNNKLRGYKISDALAEIDAEIRELRAVFPNSDIIVLSGNPYGVANDAANPYQKTFSDGLARLAAAYGCAYADGWNATPRASGYPNAANATYTYDAVHPNDAGHAILAAEMTKHFPATVDVTKVPQEALRAATVPAGAVYPYKHSRGGIKTLTTSSLTAYTDRIPTPAFFGTWTGSGPWTSSTAGARFYTLAKASEFYPKLLMGAGQGVVDIYVNGIPFATNVNLGSFANDGRYLFVKPDLPGVAYVCVVVVSGSVTVQESAYKQCVSEWIDIDAARVTVTNPGTINTSSSGMYGSHHHVTLNNTTFLFSGFGTGIGVVASRTGTGSGLYWAAGTLDGAAYTPPAIANAFDGLGAHVLTSGLERKVHTLQLNMQAMLTLGGFFMIDEHPEQSPFTCEGVAKVGETVRFPYPLTAAPTVVVTSTTANPAGASTVTATSFLATGTAGDVVRWRATSAERGVY